MLSRKVKIFNKNKMYDNLSVNISPNSVARACSTLKSVANITKTTDRTIIRGVCTDFTKEGFFTLIPVLVASLTAYLNPCVGGIFNCFEQLIVLVIKCESKGAVYDST